MNHYSQIAKYTDTENHNPTAWWNMHQTTEWSYRGNACRTH